MKKAIHARSHSAVLQHDALRQRWHFWRCGGQKQQSRWPRLAMKSPRGNDPTAHAEIVAVRDACKRLKTFQLQGCDLYTSCEPCPMCLAAIYWARIRTVFYANTRKDAARIAFDDAFIYREVALPIGKRKLVMKQLLRDEALGAFVEWRDKADKIRY